MSADGEMQTAGHGRGRWAASDGPVVVCVNAAPPLAQGLDPLVDLIYQVGLRARPTAFAGRELRPAWEPQLVALRSELAATALAEVDLAALEAELARRYAEDA